MNMRIFLFIAFLFYSCAHQSSEQRNPNSVFDSEIPSAIFLGGGVNHNNIKDLMKEVGDLAKAKASGFEYSIATENNETVVRFSCLKAAPGCSKMYDNILILRFKLLEGYDYAPLVAEVDLDSVIAGFSVKQNMERCHELKKNNNFKDPCYSFNISSTQGFQLHYVNHTIKDPDDDSSWIDIRYFPYGTTIKDFRIFSVFAEEDGDMGVMNIAN